MWAAGKHNMTGRWAIEQGASFSLRVEWYDEDNTLINTYDDQYIGRLQIRKSKTFPWIRGVGFAFVDSNPDTITHSGNGFLDAGFEDGMKVVIRGSASNDGFATLNTVAAGTMTFVSGVALTAEAAGERVTITERPLLSMYSRNFTIIPAYDDNGDLEMNGTAGKIGIHLTAKETDNLDFDFGWYDLEMIPTDTDVTAQILSSGLSFDVTVDNGIGFGKILFTGVAPLTNYLPGDEFYLAGTHTNFGNASRNTVLSASTSQITTTDVITGSDFSDGPAGAHVYTLTRLIPNEGAALRLMEGRVQLKRNITR